MTGLKIEFLYSPTTGRQPEAEEAMRLAIEATGVQADIEYVEVNGAEEARSLRFLGSPSIRVNGVDVEYGDRPPEEYHSGTRYYNSLEGWKPYPHARLIANTILEHHEAESAR